TPYSNGCSGSTGTSCAYENADQLRKRRPETSRSAIAIPSTHASTNEITVTHTSSHAPSRIACLLSRTAVQWNVYASIATAERLLRGRGRRPRPRGGSYGWNGTATPSVPTTEVEKWYLIVDGTTHFFQRPAIVWWVDW